MQLLSRPDAARPAEVSPAWRQFRLHRRLGPVRRAAGQGSGLLSGSVSDYGRLSSELFRAVRLVVDTGIHSKGWTRDQVVEFFRKTDAVDEPTLQSEPTATLLACAGAGLQARPTQIPRAARTSQQELGTRFDVRSFHDEMLNGGVLR